MCLAELFQAAREVFRHGDEAALTLHRLEHDAGDRLGIDVTLEEPLETVNGVVGRDAAVRVRRGSAVDLRREGPEAPLVGDDLARHRHRHQRPAVEGPVEDDDGRATRGHPRDLDCVLDRLRARVDEDALLLVPPAGRELGKAATHLHVWLVEADHEALMQVAVDLLVDGRHRCGEAVAGVLAPQSAGEVDVLAAVDVPDARPLGTVDDEGGRRYASGDVALSGREDAVGRTSLLQRHLPSLQR
jgi:hypothetical protein